MIRYDQSEFPHFRTPSREKEYQAWIKRRKSILEFVAKGYTLRRIAGLLKPIGANAVSSERVAPETVRSYMQRIYNELEVRGFGAAVYEAIRRGILDCPCPQCPKEKS